MSLDNAVLKTLQPATGRQKKGILTRQPMYLHNEPSCFGLILQDLKNGKHEKQYNYDEDGGAHDNGCFHVMMGNMASSLANTV